MVSADERGVPVPAGRLSDTINRGGEKFAPSEVEEMVRGHHAVRDVAAFGVPDPEMGHRVGVAVVVSEPLDLEELRQFCQGRIANFKLPERLLIVDRAPHHRLREGGPEDLAVPLSQSRDHEGKQEAL
jgi:acyl-CoA synthetase (AMP-forming)/AMP-acid ligase II